MTRQVNAAGLALIKLFEGFRAHAYRDIAGVWTIGYGHTTDVQSWDEVNEDVATAMLRADIEHAEVGIEGMLKMTITSDNEFAAMVSLAYNIGLGAFCTSSVLRYHLAWEKENAAEAFLLWDKAHVDGELVEVDGLLNRRNAERNLYLTP